MSEDFFTDEHAATSARHLVPSTPVRRGTGARLVFALLVAACFPHESSALDPIPFVRTPDAQFENLPDYPFDPNYMTLDGDLRIHYVDEGPVDGPPILLLHGEPSWSYLYRKMIPPLAAAGYRVIAPDLIGFGRSDKPTNRSDYTATRHVNWIAELVVALDLQETTLFCQDWGGLIGLRIVALYPERFSAVIAGNTGLPGGPPVTFGPPSHPEPPGLTFAEWLEYSQTVPVFDTGSIIQGATVSTMPPEVVEAYRAKPFLTTFSDGDSITWGGELRFIEHVPGAAGQPHVIIENAGHFLQEDKGEEIAALMLDFLAAGELPVRLLKMSGLTKPAGEQRATFKSDLIDATAAVYNPLGDGLSITMSEPGGPSETITIPPGDPDWKVTSKFYKWRARTAPHPQGLSSVKVGLSGTVFKMTVKAKDFDGTPIVGFASIDATLAIGDDAWTGAVPPCVLSKSGNTLKCK
jgi:haloalkane dehalogenase